MDNVELQFADAFGEVFNIAANAIKPDALTEIGVGLVGVLTFLLIAYQGIRLALTQTPLSEVIAELIQMIFVVGLVLYVINPSYGFVTAITNGFAYIADAVAVAMNMEKAEEGGAMNALSPLTDIFNAAFKMFESGRSPGWMEIPGYLGEMLYRFFIAIAIILAGVIFAATFLVAMVMLSIGAMMAPIMVPFYLIAPLSFLATGWFKFMLGAGLQQVIAITLLAASTGVLKKVVDLVNMDAAAGGNGSFAYYAAALLIIGILAGLMASVPAISMGLISGMARGEFRMPSKLTPGGGMAAAGAGSVGAAARGAGSAVGAAAKGAARGASMAAGRIAGALGGAVAGGKGGRKDGALKGFKDSAGASQIKPGTASNTKTTVNPITAAMQGFKQGKG